MITAVQSTRTFFALTFCLKTYIHRQKWKVRILSRAVIKFLTKEGAKAKEIHWHMADVYGDSSPKYSTVAKWSAEFKHGRDSLEDDPRPGRPADIISQEMIDRVERLVLNNHQIKVAELASECGISNGSVCTIIHEHLGMSKVSARWVPRNLKIVSKGCSQVKNF